MAKHKKRTQDTAGVIRYSCSILFMAFTFCYLYFIQGEVLAFAQHVYSHGITHYSVLVGAGIITVVLQVMQWVVALLSRLPQRFHALSYMPSAAALTALISLAERADAASLQFWAWCGPVILVVYVILCFIANKMDLFLTNEDDFDFSSQMYPNYLIMLVTLLTVGGMSRTDDVTFYELKTERLILEGKCDEAAEVGIKAYRSSQRLTQLRMLALSLQDSLADCLFRYPQHYGSASLIAFGDTLPSHRVNSLDIYNLFACPDDTVGTHLAYIMHLADSAKYSIPQFLQFAASDSLGNRHAADYYLCGLLLDKRMDEFRTALPLYYNLSDTIPCAYDSLPRYYKEALLFMSDEQHAMRGVIAVDGDSVATLSDTIHASRYRDYQALKIGIPNERERINKTHRKFGDTYWWYYEFYDKANGELRPRKN